MPKVKAPSSKPTGDVKAGAQVSGRITAKESTYLDIDLDQPRGMLLTISSQLHTLRLIPCLQLAVALS